MNTYKSEKFGFSFSYPSAWTIYTGSEEDPPLEDVRVEASYGPPFHDDGAQKRAEFHITVHELTPEALEIYKNESSGTTQSETDHHKHSESFEGNIRTVVETWVYSPSQGELATLPKEHLPEVYLKEIEHILASLKMKG